VSTRRGTQHRRRPVSPAGDAVPHCCHCGESLPAVVRDSSFYAAVFQEGVDEPVGIVHVACAALASLAGGEKPRANDPVAQRAWFEFVNGS
jgi:hypothetical protein